MTVDKFDLTPGTTLAPPTGASGRIGDTLGVKPDHLAPPTNAKRLKTILAGRKATILPGAPTPLFARVIEDLGFEAVYVTGAGIANMNFGVPDIGLVTLTELVDTVSAISEAVDLPLLVDADTGFGNPVNMTRTVRLLERAGAAGMQIEDQIFPKKCGHFAGKSIISASEMVQKIKAAVDTRRDQDFQIVARTDAIAVDGIDAAIERAHAYAEAGADATFVEAPETRADMLRIARELSWPQIVNVVHGGKTPPLSRDELAEMGFAVTLYANAALQSALFAVNDVLASLLHRGSLDEVRDRLASFEVRQAAVSKDKFDAMEARYK